MNRPFRRLGAVALLSVLLWSLLPAPARAAQADLWEISSFEANIVIAEDGTITVTETIDVLFRAVSHGIYREIPFRVPVDADRVRVYDIGRVSVQTGPDTPDNLHREKAGDFVVWRIGDPDKVIIGAHTYVLTYRVAGALNRFDTYDELFWNVTGDRWEVPIQRARATVQAPAITDVHCFAGPTGGTDPCADARHDGRTATFTADVLPPGSQLDVVVAMPPGVVEVAPPVIEPADPFRRFLEVQLPHVFRIDPLRAGGAGLVALLGALMVGNLARRGRDERPGPVAGVLPGGVEYRPPDGLRPAQLRTLLTERVDDVSLSATLVDLAVRGYVRIEEVPATGLLSRPDWKIHRLPLSDEGLQPYEREVLRGLFATAPLKAMERALRTGEAMSNPATTLPSVTVSALRNGAFAPYYKRTQALLYSDVVQRGFYRAAPQMVRGAAGFIAFLVLALGVAAVWAMFHFNLSFGLIVAPLPIVGLLLMILSQHAPSRTAVGAAMYQRAKGFRDFIETAEADRMDFAEREKLFVDYLPYAMVFGCVDRWVKAFERIGVPASTAAGTWYVGHGPMDVGQLTSTLSTFSSQVGGSMRHTSSAGGSSGMSGGSSGGGAGGGGGGRW